MKLCFDLLEKWISENYTGSVGGGNSVELNIMGMATYQPFDGLWEMKMVFIYFYCLFQLFFWWKRILALRSRFPSVGMFSPGVKMNVA